MQICKIGKIEYAQSIYCISEIRYVIIKFKSNRLLRFMPQDVFSISHSGDILKCEKFHFGRNGRKHNKNCQRKVKKDWRDAYGMIIEESDHFYYNR